MATDVSDVAKQGYVRVRSRTLGLWQRRWLVLRRPSSKGPCRLEKFLDERSARTGGHHKVAPLTPISGVARTSAGVRKHAFVLCFRDGATKLMACDSDMEADSWVKLLTQECLVPQPGLTTGEPDVLSPGIQKELQEQFHVYLVPTPKLDVFGECLLQVTHENIYLWDAENPRLKLVAWPLTALRRYGNDPTKFTFEAGRHCTTGEGMFVFHTIDGEKIYYKVHQATLAIAEAHHRMRKHLEKLPLVQQHTQEQPECKWLSSSKPRTGAGGESLPDVQPDSDFVAASYSESDEAPGEEVPRKATPKCSLRSHLLQCGVASQ